VRRVLRPGLRERTSSAFLELRTGLARQHISDFQVPTLAVQGARRLAVREVLAVAGDPLIVADLAGARTKPDHEKVCPRQHVLRVHVDDVVAISA